MSPTIGWAATECIRKADLERIEELSSCKRVLLKTKNSLVYMREGEFNSNFVYITKEAAQYLVDSGMKTVGLDYITIDPYESDLDAHRVFLSNNVMIIESIDLERVPAGKYTLFCVPLKIPRMDGAPARAFLYPEE